MCSTSYVFIHLTVSNDSTYKRYVTTVYWASASSTTVGYGDIIAYTDFEVISNMSQSDIIYNYSRDSMHC